MILPGLILSYAFYLPGEHIWEENKIDERIERLLLSVGLSLILIPVVTYGLNYFMTIGPNQEGLLRVLGTSLIFASAALSVRIATNKLKV